jgi:hypothetical protein
MASGYYIAQHSTGRREPRKVSQVRNAQPDFSLRNFMKDSKETNGGWRGDNSNSYRDRGQ